MYMGKLIDEPITLQVQPTLFHSQPLPTQFEWRGRRYRIETIGGQWRTLGRWWEGEGECRFVRAVTPNGLTMDLCQNMKTGHWTLHELQD